MTVRGSLSDESDLLMLLGWFHQLDAEGVPFAVFQPCDFDDPDHFEVVYNLVRISRAEFDRIAVPADIFRSRMSRNAPDFNAN